MKRMEPSVGIALRWARAALLAAVALFTGSVAHVSAGGLMPGATALVLILLASTTVAARFLGRPASTTRVIVLLMVGQTFVHGTLTALRGHRGDPSLATAPTPTPNPVPSLPQPSTGTRRVGSLYDQLYGAQGQVPGTGQHLQLTVPAPLQHLIADMTGPHALMAAAHLAAAALVGLWLAWGERSLWAMLTLLARGLGEITRPAITAYYSVLLAVSCAARLLRVVVVPAAAESHSLLRRDRMLSRSVVRRGPPALLSA